MGRPERKDVDYFPFYIKDGKTLFILESKYQCKGTGFFTNVMRLLCRTPDHYICIKDDTDRLYFFSSVKCDEESGMDMLNIMSKTGKIDAGNWVSSRVIVSQDLLDSISDAYRKRNNTIITIQEITQKYISAVGNEITADVNPIKGGDNPQTKLKKTKVKKTILNKTSIPPDLKLSDEMKTYAFEKLKVSNGDCDILFEAYKNHHIHKQTLGVDWTAAWRTWILNELKWNPDKYNKSDDPDDVYKRFIERQRLKEANGESSGSM